MWKCPHGRNIDTKFIGGVAVYYHDDGGECELLNSFNVDIFEVDDATYSLDPQKYMYVLCDCRKAVNDVINMLETANQIELVLKLRSVLPILPFIGSKLAKAFGRVLLANLSTIGAPRSYIETVRREAEKVEKPKHKMQWLNETALKLYRAMEENNATKY